MSLSDYIKYLRAVKGGLTPWEIADGSGVSARDVHLLEVKHRRMGDDDEMLGRLAQFFEVPVEELITRRDAYRKRLTFFLDESQQEEEPLQVKLESGEEISGKVLWYSREAVALTPIGNKETDEGQNYPYILQRSWIADWRAAGSESWEIADAVTAYAGGADSED